MSKPLLAITLGDPAGVGPEVIAGAWADAALHAVCRPLVLGQPEILKRAVQLCGTRAEVQPIAAPEDARPTAESIPCLPVGSSEAAQVRPGSIDARGGQAAYDALVAAAKLALAGRIDAITTAPLHKVALHLAGHDYPGHTELLAELCGVDDFAMMLYLGHGERIHGAAGLGVVHVTLHNALREVFGRLNGAAIVAKAHLAASVMQRLKGARPRIGVCALNPHAGEGGLFGDEEQTMIEPAVRAARADGLDIEGPLPTDTLLVRAADGEFDGIVAMYHDQGHIALKLLGMHRAVNITLGLPIVRTSVAHGTAFDIAWQGRAEVSSMIEAVRVAALLAEGRRGTR
jgi:4-hydroxythreonine-4-phosphate dehydrogenase